MNTDRVHKVFQKVAWKVRQRKPKNQCRYQEHARTDVSWTYQKKERISTLDQEIIKGIYGV